ncbi:MAG: hypothetical protein IJS62_00495 [Bacteroidales bacterium]|nr:hypothetical protein [Bacteroidales bacterium]
MKKKKLNGAYDWKYSSVGGMVRVDLRNGADIAHLGELDPKLWTVLSCPTSGLEFDKDTLRMLDTDADGKIRVNEVVAAARWLTSIVRNADLLLESRDTIPFSEFNTENPDGARLLGSARQILSNLGLEKDGIGIAETSDNVAIFAKTQFNGDGIITEASADEDSLKETIKNCIDAVGAKTDRSGAPGTDAEGIETFYTALADYEAWVSEGEAAKAEVFPYGDSTADALAACEALRDKIDDFFTRCKLLAFDPAVAASVTTAVEKLDDIGTCPLALPAKDAVLPFDAVNPAFEADFARLRALVLDLDFPKAKGISEADWKAVQAKFAPYTAWLGAKKGSAVEALGIDKVRELLKADAKAALLELVEKDNALKAEAESIEEVNKLTHLYRDFYRFLCNYLILKEFYTRDPQRRAVFEAGELYIDQRCCKLCVKVADMAGHADMAGLSGMFLLYCKCSSKVRPESFDIVAVMTDGGVASLRPGKNAVFYDRNGLDWDAVVTKVVDNPISIKQAFWSPYRKAANAITERINKSAAEKENKVNAEMAAKAQGETLPEPPKPAFDIAKFAGIFAAIGMAVGFLASALAAIIKPWYNVLIVFAILVVFISGPSMFLAWQKLRKRNLGPVLNANGWAINSVILVNIVFGATLTSVAKYPKVRTKDPYAKKKTPLWLCILDVLLVAALIGFALWFFCK